MTNEPQIQVTKWETVAPISRGLAIEYGLVEPTPKEAAAAQRQREEYDQRRAEEKRVLDAARETLAALTDPLTRAILDLHVEDDEHSCEGCDNDGWDEEPRLWPCLTVRGIARFYGIPLPGDP